MTDDRWSLRNNATTYLKVGGDLRVGPGRIKTRLPGTGAPHTGFPLRGSAINPTPPPPKQHDRSDNHRRGDQPQKFRLTANRHIAYSQRERQRLLDVLGRPLVIAYLFADRYERGV